MTHAELVESLRMKARASLMSRPNQRHGIATDASTLAHHPKTPVALIAIATKAGSLVIAMSMDDYNGNGNIADGAALTLLELLGCEEPTAMERAEAVVAEAEKPKQPRKK